MRMKLTENIEEDVGVGESFLHILLPIANFVIGCCRLSSTIMRWLRR